MAKLKITNLPIIYKLLILLIVVVLYVISTIISFQNLQSKINSNKKVLTSIFLEKNNYLNSIQKLTNEFIVYNHISFEKLEDFITIQNVFIQTSDSIQYYSKHYSKLITRYDENEQLTIFKTEFEKFTNIIYEIFYEYRNEEINLKNISRLFNKELNSYQQISKTITTLKNLNHRYFTESVNNIQSTIQNFYIWAILTFILFLLTFIFLIYYLFSDSFKSSETIYTYLSKLSQGHQIRINAREINPNDRAFEYLKEVNYIYSNINSYIENLLSKKYEQIEKTENPIYESLNKLTVQLVEAEKDIEKRKIEDQQKEWANNGKNLFADILRRYSNDIYKLTDELIVNFVKYLDAAVGGIYVLKEEETETNKKNVLELISAYAYDRKKYYTKKINIGEGLVGTAAQDLSPIYIKQIPEDYLEIQSGLGDAPPNNLIIIPLLTDTGLQGVLEVASFRIMEKYEIEFAEEIARNIASSLESVKINTITVELLKESQKKSQELAENEKRIQDTMKEVSKAHEIARKNEIELRGILSGVDQTLMRAEYLADGTFLNSNLVHRRVLGYELEQMKGKNILEFVQEEERGNFLKIWNEVVKGRPYHVTVLRKNRQTNQNVWLLNQYTPIKDDTGKVIKVLYLAIDITEQKLAEEKANQLLHEAQKVQVELQGILSGIDNTILRAEYSVEGLFVNSNTIHQSILGYDIKDMIGKSILDFVQKEEQSTFKQMWEEIASGKTKELIVKRFNKQTGREIWLLNQYTPIRDFSNKIIKVLYLAIDITEQKIAEEKATNLLKQAQNREILLKGFQSAIDRVMMRAEYYIDGTFIDANDLHVTTFGYDLEQMKGKNITEFVPEEERPTFQKTWNRIKRGKTEQLTAQRFNRQTGREIWLINQYIPIVNENDDIIRVLYLATDITEQKLAEQKAQSLLKQQQERESQLQGLKFAIDQTILRAEYKPDGTLFDSNTIHQQVLGYELEQMKGKNITEFVPEQDRESFITNIWEKIIVGNPLHITVKRLNKQTGKEIWLLNQYTPIFNTENKLEEVLYLAIDVTEQQTSEQRTIELLETTQEKEANLQAILSSIDQKLLRAEYSPDGIFLTSNTVHQTILGYNIEDMYGKNIFEFIPESEKEKFEETWQKVINGEPQELTVKRFNKQTGNEVWLLNQYTPVFDKKGNFNKILYLAIDISEQKMTENLATEIMLESQANEVALKALLTGIDQTVLRAEYKPDGTFITSNIKHQQLLGYTPEQFEGKKIFDFVPAQEMEQFKENWERVCQGNIEQMTVKRFNRTTNKEVWLINQYLPIFDTNNQIIKIVYLSTDISEQKRLENELVLAQQLMENNMNDLLNQYTELESKYEENVKQQKNIEEKYDSENDKLYNQWLNDFE